jgi:hypothetical protein
LASQAPDSVGLAYGGATPPPRIIAFSPAPPDFFTETKFSKTLGFISDAYGVLSGGVDVVGAIIKFLGDPKSDIEKAKEEIIAAINLVQKETLDGVWNGLQNSFDELRNDPTNSDKKEALLRSANDLFNPRRI